VTSVSSKQQNINISSCCGWRRWPPDTGDSWESVD